MGKQALQVKPIGSALHSDPATKASAAQEKGIIAAEPRATKAKTRKVAPVQNEQEEKRVGTDSNKQSLFEKLQHRINHRVEKTPSDRSKDDAAAREFLRHEVNPDHHYLYEDAPPKGELTRVLRLEAGREKLMLNQNKLTDRLRRLLNAIEASDSYLRSLSLQVSSRKHAGIVLDIPVGQQRDDAETLSEEKDPSIGLLLGKKKDDDTES